MIEQSKQFIIEDSEDSGEESHEPEEKPKEPEEESGDIWSVVFTLVFGIILGVALIFVYQRYFSDPVLSVPSDISIDAGSETIEIPITNDDSGKNITGIKVEGRSDGDWILIDEKPQLAPNETWFARVNLTQKTTVTDLTSYISVVCFSEGYTTYSSEYPYVLKHMNFSNVKNITCYSIAKAEITEENITTDIPNSDLLFRITCDNCQERSRTIIVKNLVEEIPSLTNKTECYLRFCNVNSCVDSNCRSKVNFYRIGGYNFLDFDL